MKNKQENIKEVVNLLKKNFKEDLHFSLALSILVCMPILYAIYYIAIGVNKFVSCIVSNKEIIMFNIQIIISDLLYFLSIVVSSVFSLLTSSFFISFYVTFSLVFISIIIRRLYRHKKQQLDGEINNNEKQ